MWQIVKRNFVVPALTRVGTMVGSGLVALGATQDHADAVTIGVVALGAFAVDFATDWLRRRK
jgi:hypothetical protein